MTLKALAERWCTTNEEVAAEAKNSGYIGSLVNLNELDYLIFSPHVRP